MFPDKFIPNTQLTRTMYCFVRFGGNQRVKQQGKAVAMCEESAASEGVLGAPQPGETVARPEPVSRTRLCGLQPQPA